MDIFRIVCEKVPRKQSYFISFTYNDQLIKRIKEFDVEDRKWNGINKVWELKALALLNLIKSYKGSKKLLFDFGDDKKRSVFVNLIKKLELTEKKKKEDIEKLKENKLLWVKRKDELEDNYLSFSKKAHSGLNDNISLYPHQITAIMFTNLVRNTLISHEMGLGKTLVSIGYIEINSFEKIVVITPNSLKFNYYNEVEKFTNSKAHIVNWKKNKYSIEESKYIILNYEYFNSSDKKFLDTKWRKLGIGLIDVVICDESHRLKNTKANTYKNFKRIFTEKIFKNKKVSKIFLSGTPAPNRAYELYTILNQISPLDFKTKKYFYEYYCGMTYDVNGWGWETNIGESKFEELYHKIAPYTHRKRKADVLTDLPDKIYQKIVFEMSSIESYKYDGIKRGAITEYHNNPSNNPLTTLLRLRQYTSNLKVKQVSEIVDSIIDTGEKIVIVDVFKSTLLELKKKYGDIAGLHTGDQSVEERAEIVSKFQDPNSSMKIFIGSIQTCNYGLTLTAADKMFILTLPYSVGEYDQVADRCILKGELVLTINGYIRIENIKINDLVYTSKGNWKRVINVGSKIERKKLFYDIKYKGFFKPLRCTDDHEVYVYNKELLMYEWIKASDINISIHYMVLPKININNYRRDFVVEEYKSKVHNKININLKPKLTNDLLYAFGRYVGDGHVNDHQVSICGHIDEYEDVLKSIESIKHVFGIKHHFAYNRNNTTEMYISSIELRNNFKKWFGEGAYNKSVPDFIFHLSKIQITFFLNGYYGADGYQRKNTQQASTVSKYLSYQIILLEGLLNNSPTLRFNEHAKCWSIEYSIRDKVKRKLKIENIDGNVIYPIQEIKIYKPKRDDERVYDLTIEDDESFVVGLSTVHNCHRIGQKNVVNIYPLIATGTIDESVYNAIEDKRKEVSKVIDNVDYKTEITESVLNDVINDMLYK